MKKSPVEEEKTLQSALTNTLSKDSLPDPAYTIYRFWVKGEKGL